MKKIYLLLSFMCFLTMNKANASISGADTVCAGEKVTYYVPYMTGAGYSWSITGGTPLSILTTDSLVVQWGAAGNATILVNQFNPSAVHILNVVVMPKPNPMITHAPYPTCASDTGAGQGSIGGQPDHQPVCEKVCKLSTITYSTVLHAGSTYQWVATGDMYLTGATNNTVTVTWDSSLLGSLVVYETNQWGCTDSANICVEKVNLPVANFSHPSNACKLSSVSFTNLSTGATGYQWYFGDGGSSTQTNPIHSYANAGNYTITLIAYNECHCADTFQSVINIDSLPGPTITCPATLCAYDTATYSTAAGTGCTYNWFVIGGSIIGANNLSSVTVAWGAGQTGTLGLVVSGCLGVCSDTTWLTIPIVPATATITGATKVCPGDCEYYTLPAFSGAGYTWSLNSGACGTLGDTVCCNQVQICWPNYIGACNDTLTVAYYDSFLHCGGTAQIVIHVRPRLEIYGNTKVCANTSSGFSASGSVNCFWSVSPAGPIISPNPSPVIFVNWLNTPGVYTLKAWPVNPNQACNDTAYTFVTAVAPPLTPQITGDTIVCSNSSVSYCVANAVGTVNWVITGGTPATAVGNCITVLWGNSPPFIVKAFSQLANSPNCNSDTAIQQVHLSSTALPVVTTTSPLCANATNTFTAVGLYAASATYTWSINPMNAGGVLSPNSSSTQIQWGNNAPQTVTVSVVVNVCGQTLPGSATVTLNSAPVVTATQNGNLCAGGTTTLTATGGGTYQWSGPGGFNSVLAVPVISSSGLYQVTVTGTNGCTASSQKNVQYVGGPVASISTLNSLTYCIGGPAYSVTMCALGNAGYTYAWNVGGPATQCRSFSSPGTYAVTVTDINNCSALSNLIVIQEDSCPGGGPGTCIYNGNISFTHTNCSPMTFTNTSVNSNGVYNWDFGDLAGSNLVNPTHTYTQAGFYVVTLTGYVYNTGHTDSCEVSDTAQIEIPVAAKFDTLTGCAYDPVCFTDASTYTAGNNITSWLWNFGDATTSILQSPCHLYATPGNYTVTLTVSNGVCNSVISMVINVPAQPTAAFTASTPACINQPVQFIDGSFTNINYWNWSFGDGGTSLNQSPWHSYFAAGTFADTLIIRNVFGCYDTVTSTITISTPTLSGSITAFPDTVVCAGTDVLLVAPNCATCNYLWSNGSTNDSTTVTATGIYTVTMTDAGGCPYVTFIKIIVNNAPQTVITNLGNDDLCLGEFTNLTVPSNPNWTYQWLSNDPNANNTTYSSVFVNSVSTGSGIFTYQVIITDTTTGCADTSLAYVITVHQPPVPPVINPLTSTTVCEGATIVLAGSHPDPSVSLLWTTGAIADTIYVTANGCYGLTATDTFGCSSNATLCVTVNPLPELCTFYEGCFDTCAPYTVCAPNGVAWQWLNNGVPVSGATSQCYSAAVSGAYSVIVTNNFGCVDTTGNLNLTLYPCPDSLCADFWIDSVACDSNGNHVLYYHVANQSQIPVSQVNLEILQPHLSTAFAPAVVFTTIPSQGVSQQLSTVIYNGSVGDSLCFRVHILAYDSMGHEEICCYSDTDCVVLPPCNEIHDSTCCYFNYISDSVWCRQTPNGIQYHFNIIIDGCGTLQIQSGNNTVINGNNPLVLNGSTAIISGVYSPVNASDTLMCITFVMGNGNIYCADTTVCIRLSCKQSAEPNCDLRFDDSICVGQSSTFSYGGNPTGLTFFWQFPSGSPATATGAGPHTVTYNTTGCHQVICIINNNMPGTKDCVDTICVFPPPVATIQQSGNSLFAYPAGYSYQWYTGNPGNNPINGAVNQFYNPSGGVEYYCVVVSNGSGCSDTACIDYTPTSIEELNNNSWSIYPNPNDGTFTLSVDVANNQNAEMKVSDALGQLVDRRILVLNTGNQQFFITNKNFATGIYFIQLITEAGTGTKRMVVK